MNNPLCKKIFSNTEQYLLVFDVENGGNRNIPSSKPSSLFNGSNIFSLLPYVKFIHSIRTWVWVGNRNTVNFMTLNESNDESM